MFRARYLLYTSATCVFKLHTRSTRVSRIHGQHMDDLIIRWRHNVVSWLSEKEKPCSPSGIARY